MQLRCHDYEAYSYSSYELCLLAYLPIVNYRGSTGLGQDSIDSLPGKDGTQDVGDVHVSSYM